MSTTRPGGREGGRRGEGGTMKGGERTIPPARNTIGLLGGIPFIHGLETLEYHARTEFSSSSYLPAHLYGKLYHVDKVEEALVLVAIPCGKHQCPPAALH